MEFEDRVKVITQKIGNIHSSAENVAYGNLSARQVVDVWLKSPGHRKNIEGKYTLTGIGNCYRQRWSYLLHTNLHQQIVCFK